MRSYLFKNKFLYFFLLTVLIFSCSGGKKIKSPIPETEDISVTPSEIDINEYFDSSVSTSAATAEMSREESYVRTVKRMKSMKKDINEKEVADQYEKEVPIKKLKPKPNNKKSTDTSNVTSETKLGTLVYQIPDTMTYRKTYIVRIRINRDTSDKLIIENIEKITKTTSIKTTQRMEVLIVDPSSEKSFEIVKSNDDSQNIESDEYTEWVYGVTPIKSGRLKLNIVISIIKKDSKKQLVYIDSVFVKSNPVRNVNDFFSNNWKWLMTTIIIPIVGWYYNNKKKKKKKNVS